MVSTNTLFRSYASTLFITLYIRLPPTNIHAQIGGNTRMTSFIKNIKNIKDLFCVLPMLHVETLAEAYYY